MGREQSKRENKVKGIYNIDNLARQSTAPVTKQEEKKLRKVDLKNEKRARLQGESSAALNFGIDFPSAVILSIALACIIYFALNYLTLSSQITELNKQVSSMSSELSAMTSENDQAYAAVDATVNLRDVYKVAVSELGMIYPDENQVVTYDYVQEGYVRQYQDVPVK